MTFKKNIDFVSFQLKVWGTMTQALNCENLSASCKENTIAWKQLYFRHRIVTVDSKLIPKFARKVCLLIEPVGISKDKIILTSFIVTTSS